MVITENLEILENIPFELKAESIIRRMRLHGSIRRYEDNLNEVIDLAQPVARPRAVIKIGCLENKQGDNLEINGVAFNSRLLSDKLGKIETVFVCAATCGHELDHLVIQGADVMRRFCLDAIKNQVLFSAMTFLRKHLEKKYHLDKISVLNPGETESFPIENLRNLFTILGDVESMIGVKLTDYCALVPTKSGCGIFYSSDSEFVSCRLCPQTRCTGRRAAYEPELAKNYPRGKD